MKAILLKTYFNQYTDLELAHEVLDNFEEVIAQIDLHPSVLRCMSKRRMAGRKKENLFYLGALFEFNLSDDEADDMVEAFRTAWGEIQSAYEIKNSAYTECAVEDRPTLSAILAVRTGPSDVALTEEADGEETYRFVSVTFDYRYVFSTQRAHDDMGRYLAKIHEAPQPYAGCVFKLKSDEETFFLWAVEVPEGLDAEDFLEGLDDWLCSGGDEYVEREPWLGLDLKQHKEVLGLNPDLELWRTFGQPKTDPKDWLTTVST